MNVKAPWLAFAAAAMLGACNASPTSPLQLPRRTGTDPVIVGGLITGPPALAPGESAQFRFIVQLSDATTRDLTNEVSWSTVGDDRPISISAQGLVTGRQTGDGYIAASFDRFRPVGEVIVVPHGTYRLSGSVSEYGHQAISRAALIEIIPRSGPALTTHSTTSGAYRVHGVAGEVELRVTVEGYRPFSRTLNVTHHLSYDVVLNQP